MKIKKIIKYILIVLPLLLLAKCSMVEIIDALPPGVNSHPMQKIKVYGNFPFKDEIDFGLRATYIATNSICDSVSIDIKRKAERKIDLNPIWKEGNNFEIDVFHDYLSSGICGWELGAISYTMKGKPEGIVVGNEGYDVHGKQRIHIDTFACFLDAASIYQSILVECKKNSGFCKLNKKELQQECIECNHVNKEAERYVDSERFHASYSYENSWCTAIPKTQTEIQLNFIKNPINH